VTEGNPAYVASNPPAKAGPMAAEDPLGGLLAFEEGQSSAGGLTQRVRGAAFPAAESSNLTSLAGGGLLRQTRHSDCPSNAPGETLGVRTRSGKSCQSPGTANGRCRTHGSPSPGAPKGNRNAFKHGRDTAEAIARWWEISALICAARALEETRLQPPQCGGLKSAKRFRSRLGLDVSQPNLSPKSRWRNSN
jgi:hypothetical protein